MAALLAIVSCSKNEVDDVHGGYFDDLTFTASFEGADSRVSISEDGDGYKLAWSDDDEIAVYTRMAKTKYAYDPETEVFTKASNNVGSPLEDYYYAAYPYTAASQTVGEGKVSLEMPSSQKYAENSFGKGANTMVAICPKPAEASTEPVQLQFKNVAGYLKLYLYGEDVSVTSIELKGNNGEVLSGQASVQVAVDAAPEFSWVSTTGKPIVLNCNEGVKIGSTAETATPFWLVVPPTSFEKGFNVRITDAAGRVMIKSLDKAFEISRNIVETMEPLAVEFPDVDANLMLDIHFNEDGTATDKGRYFMEVVSHLGEGMSVVSDEDYPHGNVAKFTNCDGATNAQLENSFYSIDYSNITDFKENLIDEDGFTMEMVVKHTVYSRTDQHPWQNAVSSNTFGIYLKGVDSSDNSGWMTARHAKNDANNNPFTDISNLKFSPYLNKYYHYTYVYDKANSKALFYCDGELIREVADVTIAAGSRLAIGGYPVSTNVVEHSFSGNVALVRIYDAAMTADEAKARYEELEIPSTADAVGEPIFDAKFNADGTAENVGTSALTLETKANESFLKTIDRGGHYVANFSRVTKHNNAVTDGFYLLDYSQDADFQNKLKDGYTMEIVCKVNLYEGDFWSKVFSTTTTGIHHQGAYSNEAEAWCWGLYGNGTPDSWNSGNGWNNFRKNFLWNEKVLFTYEHIVLAWDDESNVFTLYVNGKHSLSFASHKVANIGTLLAIGGIPYTNGSVYHPFVGEVAVARVYDQTLSMQQVIERYEELAPTIQSLDAASKESVESPRAGSNHEW